MHHYKNTLHFLLVLHNMILYYNQNYKKILMKNQMRNLKKTAMMKRSRLFPGQKKANKKALHHLQGFLAPQVGLEPTTLRLTAECSAIELLRNMVD